MGIDRWKQEHRNWRPNGVKFATPDSDGALPAAPSLVPNEKTSDAKPRVAKKQMSSSLSRAANSADKAQPKRSKR